MKTFRRIVWCGWIVPVVLLMLPVQTLFALESGVCHPYASMRLVNDYWMRTYPIGNAGWRFAVYQMGNMATYNDTEDIRYKNYALRWARDINLWRKGTAVPYADNLACGQVYLDLFDLDPTPIPPIPIVRVWASAHDGNIPQNTIDNRVSTRWSAEGDGQWIAFDLGAPSVIKHVSIGWYFGDRRKSKFRIEVSNAETGPWTQVFPPDGALYAWSREMITAQQAFDFPNVTARYVRYVGYGNDSLDKPRWNSLTEVDIHTLSDNRLTSIKDAVDVQLYQPGVGAWSWIDAIFMEAPVLSRLCREYQDTAYCAKLYALYRDAKISRGLYNATTKLWYEDAGFARQNILWSRGNGWVIAAHARLLEYLPLNDPRRNEYVTTLLDMANALRARQRADGFWNVSLPAPGTAELFPGPETSGTALITYAMAWGINHGLLNRTTYTPVVLKAWKGMIERAVHPEGKLGYIQNVANEPADAQPVDYNNTLIPNNVPPGQGVGPFLLAGSEIAQLQGVTFTSPCNYGLRP